MRLPLFDPAAIQVEDQRGQVNQPENFWQALLRGVENNWNNRGLAGLFGLYTPPPARTLSGQTIVINPNLGGMPVPRAAPTRSGVL